MVWELACLCPGDSVAWGTACGPAEGPCDSWARLGPYVGPVAMPRVPGSAGRPGAWRSAHPCRDPFVAVGVIASPARVPGPRVPKPPHRSAGAAIRTRAPPPVTGRGGAGCPGGSNPVSIPGWRGSGEGVRTSVPRVLLSSRSSHVVRRPRCELLVPLWWLGTNGHRVTASGGDCGCRVGRLAAVVSRGCGVHRGRRALSHAKEPGTGRRVCRVGHLCRVAAS